MAHPFRERGVAGIARAFAHFGADATYAPAGGVAGEPLRCIPGMEEIDNSFGLAPMRQAARLIGLLVEDVPERPTAGAVIVILPGAGAQSGTYRIAEDAQADDDFIVWRCRVSDPT